MHSPSAHAGKPAHLLAVEGAILPCEALADDLCGLVYEYSWLMGLHVSIFPWE